MEKRLTTTAMLFSLGFIFMLVCAVGAFFYGIQIGSDKIEEKYAAKMLEEEPDKVITTPYQQQDLVSFYHTVFTPYREFQNKWNEVIHSVTLGQIDDSNAIFTTLAKLAARKADEASSYDLQLSPLINEAQIGYIRSLNLFEEAAKQAAKTSNSMSSEDLLSNISSDQQYQDAVDQSLFAQNAYYNAMQKWAASIDPDIPMEFDHTATIGFDVWATLPLTIKNSFISHYLVDHHTLNHYYPQDLSSRVDAFIRSGHASSMNLQNTQDVLALLITTDAVRIGDFQLNKDRYYQDELLPQLPFFFNDMNAL